MIIRTRKIRRETTVVAAPINPGFKLQSPDNIPTISTEANGIDGKRYLVAFTAADIARLVASLREHRAEFERYGYSVEV